MAPDEWPQRTIQFTDWHQAEAVAVEHLRPLLVAEFSDVQWSFLRKFPCWRLRYPPPPPDSTRRMDKALDDLVASGTIAAWTPCIYEPETSAFGGPAAMETAHALFHYDSHHVLGHLARRQAAEPVLGRRELAILLLSVAMRATGLDWYEQGDVWAKVAALRPHGDTPPLPARLRDAAHRLMTIDVSARSPLNTGGGMAPLADWISAF